MKSLKKDVQDKQVDTTSHPQLEGIENKPSAVHIQPITVHLKGEKLEINNFTTLSHFLRTPLNGLLGATELLDQTNLSPTQRAYLDIIMQSSEALKKVILDIICADNNQRKLMLEDSIFFQKDKKKKITFNYQPHILLVDDNQINLKVTFELLERAFCLVETASNGLEAVNKAKTENFDLIFMDIQMPVMDGIEAAQRIRKMDNGKSTPIVALTAFCTKEDIARFIASGMSDFLPKPSTSEDLLNKVKIWTHPKEKDGINKNSLQKSFLENHFNPKAVRQLLYHLGRSHFELLIQEFDVECTVLLAAIQQSAILHDVEMVKKDIHTLKGTAGTFGLKEMHRLSKKIEEKINTGKPINFDREIQTLTKEFEYFQTHFFEYLNQLEKIHV